MTTPPETTPPPTNPPPPPPRGPERDLPIGLGMFPGNAELSIWVLALIVAMIVCWIADTLGVNDWMTFFGFTTVAYLLSRGVAKASRVYEY
jgi:hypothetical protein